MPRSTREQLLRFHEQADNDLDRHLENLRRMAATYEPVHPEIAKQVRQMSAIVIQYQQNVFHRFRDEVM